MKINENIRIGRKRLKLTQDQFAQKLDIKRSLLGAYEEGRAEPRLDLLHKMASLFGVSVDILISRDLANEAESAPVDPFVRGKEVLVITQDANKKENIELVPHKAAAGYLNGFADPEFITELPKFRLPILSQGTYRAF